MFALKVPDPSNPDRTLTYWANRKLDDHKAGNILFAARGFRIFVLSPIRPAGFRNEYANIMDILLCDKFLQDF